MGLINDLFRRHGEDKRQNGANPCTFILLNATSRRHLRKALPYITTTGLLEQRFETTVAVVSILEG